MIVETRTKDTESSGTFLRLLDTEQQVVCDTLLSKDKTEYEIENIVIPRMKEMLEEYKYEMEVHV